LEAATLERVGLILIKMVLGKEYVRMWIGLKRLRTALVLAVLWLRV
jgi:hypothetical protein